MAKKKSEKKAVKKEINKTVEDVFLVEDKVDVDETILDQIDQDKLGEKQDSEEELIDIKESKTSVETSVINAECPNCDKGVMNHTGEYQLLSKNPEKYRYFHVCNKCGFNKWLIVKYPQIQYESKK